MFDPNTVVGFLGVGVVVAGTEDIAQRHECALSPRSC